MGQPWLKGFILPGLERQSRRVEKEMTLKQVINFCIENPLKGKALTESEEKLIALEAYPNSTKQ